MAGNSTIPTEAILNPYTPLAFLPPIVANEYQVLGYVYVSTLSAYVWDWLMSIPEEYRILRKSKLSLPTTTYMLSRIGTLGYCTANVVFSVATVADCESLVYVEGAFFQMAIPATSLLFFLRVRAIYENSKIITAFFGILWVAILGLSWLLMISIHANHIPYTRRCLAGALREFTAVPTILAAINDTLIFITISYRIVSQGIVGDTWHGRARSFFKGDGLYSISKGLLQGGQVYYFVTIGFSIFTSVMALTTDISLELRSLVGPAYVALSSAMACRVFRAIFFGNIKDNELTTSFLKDHLRSSVFRPDEIASNHRTFLPSHVRASTHISTKSIVDSGDAHEMGKLEDANVIDQV